MSPLGRHPVQTVFGRRGPSDGRVRPGHDLAGTAIAIIAAYNEAAVIEAQLEHAAQQGYGVYLIDNHSTDGTLEIARADGRGSLVGFETYPNESSGRYEWARLLARKGAIAATLPSRWAIHVDADEFLEALEPGSSLTDALTEAEQAGCTAVRFRYVEFRPRATFRFPERGDPRTLLREFMLVGHPAHQRLTRAFRAGIDVDLVSSGGHEAHFPGRRVYPWRQILRHYPVLDEEHAIRKISQERRARYLEEERDRDWHKQYDDLDPAAFLADGVAVERWDPAAVRALLRADAASEIEAEWAVIESAVSSTEPT